mmetsp:Transcript_6512/g.16939  ORF Transcript_6512/g.16939 Transcript_6512/m.16939 type:complete len:219 (-) Transcript_6512:163-819(-)
MSAARGGGVTKSKASTSSTPSALSHSVTLARFARRISAGDEFSSSCEKVCSVYSRKHLPALSRPARPARWRAAAFETGTTCSESTPLSAWNCRLLVSPQSMTYRTPGTVSDVSAMVVQRIALRTPNGAGSSARNCAAGESAAYIGTASSLGQCAGSSFARSCSSRAHASISSAPVRKTRMSPSAPSPPAPACVSLGASSAKPASSQCTCSVAVTAAST